MSFDGFLQHLRYHNRSSFLLHRMLVCLETVGRLLRLSRENRRFRHTHLENEATRPPKAGQAVMHGDTESIQSAPGRGVKRRRAERYGGELKPHPGPLDGAAAGVAARWRGIRAAGAAA